MERSEIKKMLFPIMPAACHVMPVEIIGAQAQQIYNKWKASTLCARPYKAPLPRPLRDEQ